VGGIWNASDFLSSWQVHPAKFLADVLFSGCLVAAWNWRAALSMPELSWPGLLAMHKFQNIWCHYRNTLFCLVYGYTVAVFLDQGSQQTKNTLGIIFGRGLISRSIFLQLNSFFFWQDEIVYDKKRVPFEASDLFFGGCSFKKLVLKKIVDCE